MTRWNHYFIILTAQLFIAAVARGSSCSQPELAQSCSSSCRSRQLIDREDVKCQYHHGTSSTAKSSRNIRRSSHPGICWISSSWAASGQRTPCRRSRNASGMSSSLTMKVKSRPAGARTKRSSRSGTAQAKKKAQYIRIESLDSDSWRYVLARHSILRRGTQERLVVL